MTKGRSRRRELMPIARVQLKLVALVCVPIVLTCLIVSSWQTYFFLTSVGSYKVLSTEFARELIPIVIYIGLITLLVLIPVLVLVVLWLSQRIVGPMRRLETRLKGITQGRTMGPFGFRKGDDLAFVGEAVAEMEKTFRERLLLCHSTLRRLEQCVNRVRSENGQDAGREEIRESSAELAEAVADLRSQIDTFGLNDEMDAPQG